MLKNLNINQEEKGGGTDTKPSLILLFTSPVNCVYIVAKENFGCVW